MAAFSKINLFLEIVRKRADGYHELVTVMQRLNLQDKLTICTGTGTNNVQLETNIATLPTDDTNLIVKAAKLLIEKYNITQSVQIKLDKHIPIGAGLGGGSSDCAATLIGMNQLFGLNISISALLEIGKTLGADVPFCIFANTAESSGTAIATGIGELLTPLEPHPSCCVVLAYPNIHVSTKEIFKKIAERCETLHGQACNDNAYGLASPRPAEDFTAAYNSRNTNTIAKNFYNRFTQITSEMHPQILTLISDLQNQGALGASMTGTGATVFAYFNNENNACLACDKLQQKYEDVNFFITNVN